MIEASVAGRVVEAPEIPGLRFRSYGGPGDLAGMVDVSRAANLVDDFDEVPTVGQLANELDHPDGFDPFVDILVAEIGNRIVASSRVRYTLRDDEETYELSGDVHPEFRRRGIGRALLRAGEAHALDRARARRTGSRAAPGDTNHRGAGDGAPGPGPSAGPTWLSTWGPETAAGLVALMRSERYEAIRYFFEMIKADLSTPGAIPLPDGLELRPVTRGDLRRIFDAEAEAFQDHWGRRDWSDAIFETMAGSPDLDLSLWRVAWDGDEVAGVVATSIFEEENAALGLSRGWLERISVRRPWRKRGVASSLIVSACEGLRARGIRDAALGVDADNPTGALGLYEGLGFVQHQRAIAWRKRLDLDGD